jgi:hypothetical protein
VADSVRRAAPAARAQRRSAFGASGSLAARRGSRPDGSGALRSSRPGWLHPIDAPRSRACPLYQTVLNPSCEVCSRRRGGIGRPRSRWIDDRLGDRPRQSPGPPEALGRVARRRLVWRVAGALSKCVAVAAGRSWRSGPRLLARPWWRSRLRPVGRACPVHLKDSVDEVGGPLGSPHGRDLVSQRLCLVVSGGSASRVPPAPSSYALCELATAGERPVPPGTFGMGSAGDSRARRYPLTSPPEGGSWVASEAVRVEEGGGDACSKAMTGSREQPRYGTLVGADELQDRWRAGCDRGHRRWRFDPRAGAPSAGVGAGR